MEGNGGAGKQKGGFWWVKGGRAGRWVDALSAGWPGRDGGKPTPKRELLRDPWEWGRFHTAPAGRYLEKWF